MDEGTRAAVQAALEAVQAARSSADGIDTSSLKGQPSDTSPLKNAADTLKSTASSTSTAAQKTQGAVHTGRYRGFNRRGDHRAS